MHQRPRATDTRIFGIARERTVERSQRLARPAQRQINLAEHALHPQCARIRRLQFLAVRQRLFGTASRDLRLRPTQALGQCGALHLPISPENPLRASPEMARV